MNKLVPVCPFLSPVEMLLVINLLKNEIRFHKITVMLFPL